MSIKMLSRLVIATMLMTCIVSVCSAAPVLSGMWVQQVGNNPGVPGHTDAESCSRAAYMIGGTTGVEDVVAAVAQSWPVGNKTVYYCYYPFPGVDTNTSYHAQTDLLKPMLDRAKADGRQVVLNVQPEFNDPTVVINTVLDQYCSKYPGTIIQVTVDMEFANYTNPQHCNNSQRDAWLNAVKTHIQNGKLGLITYHADFGNYFPDNKKDVVFMYDGLNATQSYILSVYGSFPYSECGIYTGYPGNTPYRTATLSEVLAAQKNTTLYLNAGFDVTSAPQIAIDWTTDFRPQVNFTSNVTNGSGPLAVSFTGVSTNATSWNWNLGDGSNSTQQNPVHTFATAGNYTVNLTATNQWGSNSKTSIITVTSAGPAVFPGCIKLPTDPDHDGLYEDINGNGDLEFTDCVIFNNNLDMVTPDQIKYYDFNHNGDIEYADAVLLYNMI